MWVVQLDFKKNSILDYGNPEIKRFVKRLARRKERNTLKKLDGYMSGNQIHKITGKDSFSRICINIFKALQKVGLYILSVAIKNYGHIKIRLLVPHQRRTIL